MQRPILVTGNPVDGLSFIGPFTDDEEAMEYADQHYGGTDWWLTTIEAGATAARDENARDLHFEEFEQGYWQALLWADGPTGNTLMPENVDPDAAKSVRDELRAFVTMYADDLAEYLARVPTAGDGTSPDMQAGGDLALTRNGHGSGFWDHAPILGAAAARLADGARALGPVRVTVGEDDRVTISPA